MPKFIVVEAYSGTREVEIEADNADLAIRQVRVGCGTELHRYEEPIAPYEVTKKLEGGEVCQPSPV